MSELTEEGKSRVARAFAPADRPRAADAQLGALVDGIRAGAVAAAAPPAVRERSPIGLGDMRRARGQQRETLGAVAWHGRNRVSEATVRRPSALEDPVLGRSLSPLGPASCAR